MKTSIAILVFSLITTSPALVSGITIAQWTFETSSLPATASTVSGKTLNGSTQGLGNGMSAYHDNSSTVWNSPAGYGSAKSLSANHWSVEDYWQFEVSTAGFKDIQISFDQYGSPTGPRDFSLEYSTDGGAGFSTFASYSITSPNSWASESFDLSSLLNLVNPATVYFRLVDVSTNNINGGTVGTSGTDRIDNFTVTGDAMPAGVADSLPAFASLGCALGLLAVWRIRNTGSFVRQGSRS